MNAIKLGKFLAQLRNEKGYTQDALAEKLFVDSKRISRWECGNSIPDFDMLINISKVLDVTLYELSICERIKDKTILEKTKDKLKTLKDYRLLSLKKKLMIVLAILLGIFFGLTTIYTVKYYGTVKIYGFRSDDSDYYIYGYYLKSNDYSVFSVNKIDNITDNIFDKDLVNNIHFQLLDEKLGLIHDFGNKFVILNNEFINISNMFKYINLVGENIENEIPVNEKLVLRIMFENKEHKNKYIDIKFKLTEKFINKF